MFALGKSLAAKMVYSSIPYFAAILEMVSPRWTTCVMILGLLDAAAGCAWASSSVGPPMRSMLPSASPVAGAWTVSWATGGDKGCGGLHESLIPGVPSTVKVRLARAKSMADRAGSTAMTVYSGESGPPSLGNVVKGCPPKVKAKIVATIPAHSAGRFSKRMRKLPFPVVPFLLMCGRRVSSVNRRRSMQPRHDGVQLIRPSAHVFREAGVDHQLDKLVVGLGVGQALDQKIGRLHGAHRTHQLAQKPRHFQLPLGVKQLFLAGARAMDVDRREDAPFGQPAIQMELHVTGTLKLFVDDLVHPASRFHQCSGQDGEASSLFDVAS